MNKLLYYLTLLIILLPGKIYAQHISYPDNLFQAIALGRPTTTTPQHKTNALMSRMVALSTYLYSTSANAFVIHDSMNFIYSGDRGGDAANITLCKYDTANFISPNLSTGSFPITHRYTATYNVHDNVVSNITAVYNQTTGDFIEQLRANHYYDANEYLISDTTFSWSSTTREWIPTGAWLYNNNANGKPLSVTHYIYDNSRQQWVRTAAEKVEYVYDANGNLIERTFIANNMGMLENQSRDVFTYNVNGKNTSYIRQEWTYIYTWENTTEVYYTLNASGDAESALALQYNRASGIMDTISNSLNSYDANHNLTEIIWQEYDYNTHTFVNVFKRQQTYNSFNQLTGHTFYRWLNGSWVFDEGSAKMNYYYETYFPTDVAWLQKQGGTLQLYPVPTANTLYLQLSEQQQQQYSLSITDMQGRQVLQQTYTGNTIQAINTSALPAGVYNLSLLSTNGHIQYGRFSVVR